MKGFNHYCAKHHVWWNTTKTKDCPECLRLKAKPRCTKQICHCENNGVCIDKEWRSK